jgi:hypothetical protein
MEKIFNHNKSFNYLFGHLWEVELTFRYIFAFKFTLRSQQADIFHYLPPVANLSPLLLIPGQIAPVSTTLAKLVAKFAISVVDTSGKFATGVIDTGGAP